MKENPTSPALGLRQSRDTLQMPSIRLRGHYWAEWLKSGALTLHGPNVNARAFKSIYVQLIALMRCTLIDFTSIDLDDIEFT